MFEQVDIGGVYEEFMVELFDLPKSEWEANFPANREVARSRYTEVMKKVQDEHGLKQGHPQFMEWIFTCVGRSPIIVDDNE